jgi:hypothetical protein
MSSLPLLRPLTVGEIIDRAFRIYRSHFVLLISIPLLVLVPLGILRMLSQLLWRTTRLVDLLQSGFMYVLVTGALVIAISQAYLTHPPTIGEAYQAAVRRYWAAWRGNFLMGIAIVLPGAVVACAAIAMAGNQGIWLVLLFILPFAIFLSTRWSVMLPGILLEDLGAAAGLGRSWTLTEGYFGKVFVTSFFAGLLVVLLSTLPTFAVTYGLEMFLPRTGIGSLIEIILTQLGIIVTMPLSLGVTVVLYYDLRVRKEGFDLEWQMQQTAPV